MTELSGDSGWGCRRTARVWLQRQVPPSPAKGSGLPPTAASRPQERPDPKDWSLQDTDAFVLVYDICSPDSFDYVKALRQRIAETR